MGRWTDTELNIVKNMLVKCYPYKLISKELEDKYNIIRTPTAIGKKCSILGWKNCTKTTERFIDEMKIINHDIEILGEYVKNSIKTSVRCTIDNHVWDVRPASLLAGQGCPVCANRNRTKSKDTFVFELQEINKNIKPLDMYINDHTKLNMLCLTCSNIWYATPNNLLRGRGCPICANKHKVGAYRSMSKKQLDLLDYSLYLYHVKLQYKDEVFYKFGITKNKDRSRYYYYKPYKVIEEISFKEYNAYDAVYKEKLLKSNYKPKYKFLGYSECYIGEVNGR